MTNLRLSAAAQSDLAEIKCYIAKELENPTAALSVVGKITRDIRRLREYPLIGAPLRTIADVETDYRFLTTGNYLTFYRVCGENVYVERVLYGRSDYLRILLGDTLQDGNDK